MFSNQYSLEGRKLFPRSSWMVEGTGVEIAQNPYELNELLEIFKRIQPMRILEIGTYMGGTLYCWANNAPENADVISIDLESYFHGQDWFEVWQSVVPDNVNYYCIMGDSHAEDTLNKVKAITDELDFLFIDGDHTYDGAKNDFEMYGPLVRKGGVIAFHDLQTPDNGKQEHIQVGRLFKEIQRAGYRTRELHGKYPNPWGGGIGVVYV